MADSGDELPEEMRHDAADGGDDMGLVAKTNWEMPRLERLRERDSAPSRSFDWEFIRGLGLEDRMTEILATLGLTRVGQCVRPLYRKLTMEFLMTFKKDSKKLTGTFRLGGTEYTLTPAMMNDAWGMHLDGELTVPNSWDANEAWAELTSYGSWSSGISNTYLEEPVLVLLHKFIAPNISAKLEGNKISLPELWMLHRAHLGIKVSLCGVMFGVLESLVKRKTLRPCVGFLVTLLASSLGIDLDPYEAEMGPTLPSPISYAELKHAGYMADASRFKTMAERAKTMKLELRPVMDDVGPSYAALHSYVKERFNKLDARFESMVTVINARFDALDARFRAMELRQADFEARVHAYFRNSPPKGP